MTMIRVSRKEGADGPLLDVLRTSDPVEAEAHYLRLCRVRTDGPGLVRVVSRVTGVDPGAYRTDDDWEHGLHPHDAPAREQERARHLQIWAYPDQRWSGPTPFQLRAVQRVIGLPGAELARRLGISGRLWRYWVGGDDERRIDWPSWRVLLSWAGVPEPAFSGPGDGR